MSSTAIERRGRSELGAASALARLSPEQIGVVKATVAKGATDTELAMFLELANRYQLDPFAKEIWCICELEDNGSRKLGKDGQPRPAIIQSSRDGYLAIANRNPAFAGMASDVVREGDTFARRGTEVEHAYGAKRGNIVGAYALVYRRDRDLPAFFFAPWSEYGAPAAAYSKYSAWAKYPSAMIVKVAEAMALRRAFSISGLVTQEEMDAADVEAIESPARPAGQRAPAPEVWKERWAAVQAAAETAGIDAEVLRTSLKADYGMERPSDLADDERYRAVMAELQGPGVVDGEVVDETTGEVTTPAETSPTPAGEPGAGDEAEGPAETPGPSVEPEQQVIEDAGRRRQEDPG